MTPQSLGERIGQARREKGVRDHCDVRPVDVARALGVSGAAVSDWEADKKTPREELLVALAEYLGVTPQYLRYGVREQATNSEAEAVLARLGRAQHRDPQAIIAENERPPKRRRGGRKAG